MVWVDIFWSIQYFQSYFENDYSSCLFFYLFFLELIAILELFRFLFIWIRTHSCFFWRLFWFNHCHYSLCVFFVNLYFTPAITNECFWVFKEFHDLMSLIMTNFHVLDIRIVVRYYFLDGILIVIIQNKGLT